MQEMASRVFRNDSGADGGGGASAMALDPRARCDWKQLASVRVDVAMTATLPRAICVSRRWRRRGLNRQQPYRRARQPWHPCPVTGQELAAIIRGRVGPERVSILDEAGFGSSLERAVETIGQRWPSQRERLRDFADYLTEQLLSQEDLRRALPRLQLVDLFLAFWAGSGDQGGIAAFEENFAEDLAKLARRFHKLPEAELRQRLRIKLFVAEGGRAPRIRDYSGFGFLQNWLRVTAVRTFIDMARTDDSGRRKEVLDEKRFLAVGDPSPGPALGHVRAEVNTALKEAFATAVSELPPRSRNFLRHAHVEQLTLDQIASLYNIHRATVARTLSRARTTLMEKTRAGLMARLGIDPEELDSAIGYLDSRLDLSLSRVLDGDGSES